MEKATRIISLLLVVVCTLFYFACPDPVQYGLVQGSTTERITYLWFHGNLLHLGINLYAMCTLTFLFDIDPLRFMLGLVVAMLVPDCCLGSMPIVGLSGWIFFLSGSLTFRLQEPKRFLFNNVFIILATSLLSHIAWGVHFWCFALGFLYSYIESNKATGKRTA